MSRNMARWGILLLGAACLGWGLARGEVAVIFAKAVRVCLECIGLG